MSSNLSIVAGPPLSEEPGLGALTLGGWLREVTEHYADREALVFHDGGREIRWTYAELWRQAFDVARALIATGLAKGGRVGVMMTNRPEFLASVFGVALAGGVAATFSTFSTASELDHLLRSSCCSTLLFERHVLRKDFGALLSDLEPALSAHEPGTLASTTYPFLRRLVAIGETLPGVEAWDAFVARSASTDGSLVDAAAATVTPSDPGLIFFSSGTTSKPKGILSAHRGPTLQLWRWKRFYGSGDDVRAWSANGFFWSGNFCMALGGALSAGGALVLQPTFQAEEALNLMERERATMAIAWPHQWAQLEAADNWSRVDLSSLKYVSPQTPLGRHATVQTDWQEPTAAYGNTETFTVSAIFPTGTSPDQIGGSHGMPLPGNVFKIVEPLSGALVPLGDRGEIAVKGPTLMLGYLGIPLDETLDADGYFRTGDGGWFDGEGRLHWEGRLNDIIKTGGANVSPVEIDAVLKHCAGIKIVQTVGVPHETLGEMVVACVVLREDAELTEAGVKDHARGELASYKVPRRVLFFAEDEIALTGSAKVKTGDLKALAVARLGEDHGLAG